MYILFDFDFYMVVYFFVRLLVFIFCLFTR